MIIVIDNYDSFTYNLVDYLQILQCKIKVFRNDAISVDSLIKMQPKAIVISPGPGTPDDSGICLDLVAKVKGNIPILGICLGHQVIAQYFGSKIIKYSPLRHGKISIIKHNSHQFFKDIPTTFNAVRYHSLIIDRHTLPEDIEITSTTENNIIMSISHRKFNIHGVQFHPESIASEYGLKLLSNFLELIDE